MYDWYINAVFLWLVYKIRKIVIFKYFFFNVKKTAKYMVLWGITWRLPNQKSFGRAHGIGA